MSISGGYRGLQQAAQNLLGVNLSRKQQADFQLYREQLTVWNQRFNLTAITDPQEIEIKHFLDSLTCLLVMDLQEDHRLVDVGSGAGFPGLPLKLIYPDIHLTLVESNRKKVEFMEHMVKLLELTEVEVVNRRVEDLGKASGYRDQYDWAVARAVALMPVLLEYLLPLLRVGGQGIAQKGEAGLAEVHEADPSMNILGGKLRQIIPVELPTVAETRYLILFEKVAGTPARYPRRAGIPAKRPL
jgi:16S rRNA (guanine527-N7)-methyltransferase